MILKNYHPIDCTNRYIKQLRKVENIDMKYNSSHGIMRLYYKTKLHFSQVKLEKMGMEYNIEIGLHSCKEGLKIWHTAGGIVINQNARIGKNLTLHGCNCIGNDGINTSKAPSMGDNIHMGFGACVIGDVSIADNVWIAAGAVVTTSFEEPNIVIGGIPARKIKDL